MLEFPRLEHFEIEFLPGAGAVSGQVGGDKAVGPRDGARGFETADVETLGAEKIETCGHGGTNAGFADGCRCRLAGVAGKVVEALVGCVEGTSLLPATDRDPLREVTGGLFLDADTAGEVSWWGTARTGLGFWFAFWEPWIGTLSSL